MVTAIHTFIWGLACVSRYLFIYFRLHWVLTAVRGLSLSMMVLRSTGSTAQAQQLGAQA